MEILGCGLGGRNETRSFHVSSYNELGSFSPTHSSAWTAQVVDTEDVPMQSLETFVEEGDLPPPDHLKIDVGGYGLHVLRGPEWVHEEHHPKAYLGSTKQEMATTSRLPRIFPAIRVRHRAGERRMGVRTRRLNRRRT